MASAGDLCHQSQSGHLVAGPAGPAHPFRQLQSTKKGEPCGLALEKPARHLPLLSSALSCSPAVHLDPKVATVLSRESMWAANIPAAAGTQRRPSLLLL